MEDNLSRIDSSSEKSLDEEDEREMLGYLSEMVFAAPFEKYVENMYNKLIKNNYNKIPPFFEQKEYSLVDTIEEFQNCSPNTTKEKKKINKFFNNQPEINKDEFEMNLSQNKSTNNSGNKISEDKKVSNENISYKSMITEDSIDDFFNKSKNFQEKSIISKASSIENIKGNKKLEINDFLDTFTLKGKEFEYHVHILLVQILKCLEKEDNSFKFLRNIEFKFGNTDKDKDKSIKDKDSIINEKKLDIKDIELDFTINNINSVLLCEFLEYLKNNILIFKFQGNTYEINQSKDFENNLSNLKKFKNFDVLGEIGLNALNDENKIKQFKNYFELINTLKSNESKNNNKINLFFEKTGFLRENEKLVFFVTDSRFNEMYKCLKNTKLYKEMMDSKIDINCVLCYLSSGINEQIILNKFIIDYKSNKEDIENKRNPEEIENKKNSENKEIKESPENKEKNIYDKIKSTYKNFLKSEKFQISCNKINELLIGLDNIKYKFNKSKKDVMKNLFNSFNQILQRKQIKLNKELEKYFKSQNIPINFINKHNIEEEIVVIYLKGKNDLIKDIVPDILNEYKIKFITINYEQNDDTQKKYINNLKKFNNLFKIYIFIFNLDINEEIDIQNYLKNINLKITEAHYIFIYDSYFSVKSKNSYNTLDFNIKICKDKQQFGEQYNATKEIIESYYKDLEKIIIEKMYYDRFIKIYNKNTKNYIKNLLESDEQNLILKINEILYFISNLELQKNIPQEVTEFDLKNIYNFINNIILDFIEPEINKKNFDNIFHEVKKFLNRGIKIDSIKNSIKNYYIIYLRRCIFKEIYDYFINSTIPKISFRIFNEKIKLLLEKANKEKNN